VNVADLTLFQYTSRQLRNLCQVAGFDESDDTPTALLRELLGPAGDRPLSAPPLWPSDVSDDATPVEFSIAFDESGERAIRILGETIAGTPSAQDNVVAAERFLDHLAQRFQISLDRFNEVRELFLPEQPQGSFAMWYSLILRPHSPPRFKVYFNPAVRGDEQAPGLVAEGLRRLGLDNVYDLVAENALSRGELDRFTFFALDLDNSPLSRVKLYISHYSAEVRDVERAARPVEGIDPARIREFCSLIGGKPGPFARRPLISSYSFVEADPEHPGNFSLYLPVRDYVPDDEVARARVLELMRASGLGRSDLDDLIRAVSDRRLAAAAGLLAHVSLRLGRFGSGFTVYLSSEAFTATPAAITS
jgi:DMATS type aromatic prenyltransferase